MTITLRSLHRRVRVKVPHVLEAVVTAALQDAAIFVCQETHASRQTIAVSVDNTTVFPLALTPLVDTEICGFVSASIKLDGATTDMVDLPPADWPTATASSTKGSPSRVAYRDGEVVLIPAPSAAYDLSFDVAVAPSGDFTTVDLPRDAESAIIDLALAELYMQPDEKGKIRAELSQIRHRMGINKVNELLFKSVVTSTGEARIGVDPSLSYFGR